MVRKKTTEEFIEEATIKHGGKYSYEKVVYTNIRQRLIVICPEHGDFEQLANSHLQGDGCASCSGNKPHDNNSFVKKLNEVHKGEIILCEGYEINGMIKKYRFRHKCGFEWEAKAANVLHGSSCPRCSVSGFDPSKPATFYILSINGEHSFTGFGISSKYKQRKKQHQKKLKEDNCSIQSEILITSDGAIIQELESYIKQALNCNNSNINGFKTESVLISANELKDFAIRYLDRNNNNYKLTV